MEFAYRVVLLFGTICRKQNQKSGAFAPENEMTGSLSFGLSFTHIPYEVVIYLASIQSANNIPLNRGQKVNPNSKKRRTLVIQHVPPITFQCR